MGTKPRQSRKFWVARDEYCSVVEIHVGKRPTPVLLDGSIIWEADDAAKVHEICWRAFKDVTGIDIEEGSCQLVSFPIRVVAGTKVVAERVPEPAVARVRERHA